MEAVENFCETSSDSNNKFIAVIDWQKVVDIDFIKNFHPAAFSDSVLSLVGVFSSIGAARTLLPPFFPNLLSAGPQVMPCPAELTRQ